MKYSYELKISKDRLAVLIGKDGEVKKDLESATNTEITIDSREGDILVSGEDALGLYTAREIIKAIGRGYNPNIAKMLLKADYCFEIIVVSDFAGKSKDAIGRLKGRVIGRDGKSRKVIEELTETYISVYGKKQKGDRKRINTLYNKKFIPVPSSNGRRLIGQYRNAYNG